MGGRILTRPPNREAGRRDQQCSVTERQSAGKDGKDDADQEQRGGRGVRDSFFEYADEDRAEERAGSISFAPLGTPRFGSTPPVVDSSKEPKGSKEKPTKETAEETVMETATETAKQTVSADQPGVQGKSEVSTKKPADSSTKSSASDDQWKTPSSGTPMETEQKNVLGLSFPPLATPRFDTPAVDSPKEPEGSKEKPMKETVPADQPAVQGKTEVSSSNYTCVQLTNTKILRCSSTCPSMFRRRARRTLGDLLCGRAKGPE